ncbi:hypothetical protein E6C27_scaffold2484G00560 [Cucumis melo var. makuwa]|uniref:Uncharacterized protein n=1 Tax=Cucumis melo var. makuwa TaxID=1194695 RepID=A0A5A7VKW6_CUCMM|nr:hypothetical protein E6C27_scaffold2484G00560 [Cucumis melo var. makuwa]
MHLSCQSSFANHHECRRSSQASHMPPVFAIHQSFARAVQLVRISRAYPEPPSSLQPHTSRPPAVHQLQPSTSHHPFSELSNLFVESPSQATNVSFEFTKDQFVLGVPLGSPKTRDIPTGSHIVRVREHANLGGLTLKFTVPRQVKLEIAFLSSNPWSVDSIGGHNQVSGKGFPTTGPRIEAGNVVTRPLVVACVPSGVRNSVRIGTDAGCSPSVETLIMEFGRGRTCTLRKCASFGSTRLIYASFGSTRLICVSFGSTRLICASLGITRLIGVSFGITRLICVFYGTTRLLYRVRVQRGADRREAGRMREGHMDVSGFLIASADAKVEVEVEGSWRMIRSDHDMP